MLIDSHCHLDAVYFPEGPDAVLERGRLAGVGIAIGVIVSLWASRFAEAFLRKLLQAGADKVSINTAAVNNRHFVKEASEKFGAGIEQPRDVLDRSHSAPDGQRHEAALSRLLDDVQDRVAILVAGGNIEEAQLVGAGLIICGGGFDRIAGIDKIDEVDALDDASVLHVEAGNDASFEHGVRRALGG